MTLLVGALSSSTTTAQSVESSFINDQGIAMFCIQSESEGTGINSESEGTGLNSSESEGTGVNAVNCYPFD